MCQYPNLSFSEVLPSLILFVKIDQIGTFVALTLSDSQGVSSLQSTRHPHPSPWLVPPEKPQSQTVVALAVAALT